jgi:hypothetical protein
MQCSIEFLAPDRARTSNFSVRCADQPKSHHGPGLHPRAHTTVRIQDCAQPSEHAGHSRQNARVKELRSGFARAARTDEGHIAIEGEHLVAEAIASGIQVSAVKVLISVGPASAFEPRSARSSHFRGLPRSFAVC